MAFLSFFCIKFYYYLIIYWILDLLIIMIKDFFYKYEEVTNREYLKDLEFVYISGLNIADLFAGFLVLFTKFRMKTKKEKSHFENEEEQKKENLERIDSSNSNKSSKFKKDKKNKKSLNIELIYNDNSIRQNKNFYLFLISILEFIIRCNDIFYLLFFKNSIPIRPGEINWLIFVDTLARIIFSYLILKTKIYKHHKCSILLIIISIFPMSICAFEEIVKSELDNWPYFLFLIIKYSLNALEDVINKILLTDEFLLPQYLMFYRGIFNFFMLIILGLTTIIPGFVKFEYFSQLIEPEKTFQISLKVLFIIASFFQSFCLLKALDISSPAHIACLNTALTLYQCLKCRILTGDDVICIILDAIFLIVIIFANLVFNEMIIINKWGLNKNTKKAFIMKEKQEFQDINTTIEGDSEDDLENNSKDEENNETIN